MSDHSEAEYLEQGGGARVPTGSGGSGRKRLLLGGGAVVALALVGGGVWAAMSFFSQGAQPAEALPSSTVGYASVDLDPSGGQKVEALRMLNKFPAFEEELGLDTDDDLRRKLFDESGITGECPDLDYGDDVEPWLGQRFAVAAVDLGEEQPTPVVVVQVQDAAAAEDGMTALVECGGEGAGGWAIEGDWMVVAETEDLADQVVEATADGSLADDEDYQRWTDEVGDAGVVNAFVAPEAADLIMDFYEDSVGLGSVGGTPGIPPGTAEEMEEALDEFSGAAATLRFSGGALELELASDAATADRRVPVAGDAGDDVLATLPGDTAAAFGVGFADGWFGTLLETMAADSDVDDLIAQMEAESGLSIPEDVETLAGESAAFAVSADIDIDAFVNGSTPEGLPFGVKVEGDPEAIEEVLDTLRSQMGELGKAMVSETSGDMVAISPSEDYVDELAEEGDLGDSDTFQNVVREAEDASAILFVDFDAGDGWLVDAVGGDQEVAENLEPLEGLGMSSWIDDEAGHMVLRVTTD